MEEGEGDDVHGGNGLRRFEFTEMHMGCRTRIVAYCESPGHAEAACAAAFERIEALCQVASDYRNDSELAEVHAAAGGAPVVVSPDFARLLSRSLQVARMTDGLFDPTVGSVTSGTSRLVDWRLVEWDEAGRKVRLKSADLRLDFGAVAKGDACDQALLALAAQGVASALVDCGGDLAVSGPLPDGRPWELALPDGAHVRGVHFALSTSGPHVAANRPHLVTPGLAEPAGEPWLATTRGKAGLLAEPWSTVASLAGPGAFAREMAVEGVELLACHRYRVPPAIIDHS